MNTSEQINEIATALAKAQGEMENASKNMKNGHFKNEYADLAEILSTVRPVLSRHGIAIVQLTEIEGDAMILHTRLVHTSGQWFSSVHPIAKLPEKPQIIGANETYARRYSLAAIAGIAQEDDDLADGKNAAPAAAPPKPVNKHEQEATHRRLVSEGEAMANEGMARLESWWTGLATADKKLVGKDTLTLLKSIASGDKQQPEAAE